MKLKYFATSIVALLAAATVQAQIINTSFLQNVNLAIPDDNPNGVRSTLNVSLGARITSIGVTLDITNAYNGDYYAYLVDPSGNLVVLLNRVGVDGSSPFGYSDSGFHITLTDSATNNIHFYQSGSYTLDADGALTGLWGADGRYIDPATNGAAIANAAPTATLGSILGDQTDGTWTFFIADVSGGYEGTLQDWGIQLIADVPEPATSALFVTAGLCGAFALYRRKRK